MSTHTPAVHSVHIYNDSPSLISRLCGIVLSGLQVGDAVLIVATSEHRSQLVKELHNSGIDVRVAAREGRYTMVDASEMLSSFMLHGMPDYHLFNSSVGELLAEVRRKSRSKGRGLTVFGEMVAVLWERGHKTAALELEELWNDVLAKRAFHLHCAYSRSGFVNEDDEAAVCKTHSHVLTQ